MPKTQVHQSIPAAFVPTTDYQKAIAADDLETVKRMVEDKENPAPVTGYNYDTGLYGSESTGFFKTPERYIVTPLHFAAFYGRQRVIEYLLSNDTVKKKELNQTIHCYGFLDPHLCTGTLQRIKPTVGTRIIHRDGTSVDYCPVIPDFALLHSAKPLFFAVREGHTEAALTLLRFGASLNTNVCELAYNKGVDAGDKQFELLKVLLSVGKPICDFESEQETSKLAFISTWHNFLINQRKTPEKELSLHEKLALIYVHETKQMPSVLKFWKRKAAHEVLEKMKRELFNIKPEEMVQHVIAKTRESGVQISEQRLRYLESYLRTFVLDISVSATAADAQATASTNTNDAATEHPHFALGVSPVSVTYVSAATATSAAAESRQPSSAAASSAPEPDLQTDPENSEPASATTTSQNDDNLIDFSDLPTVPTEEPESTASSHTPQQVAELEEQLFASGLWQRESTQQQLDDGATATLEHPGCA